jgi:hypothetical protein
MLDGFGPREEEEEEEEGRTRTDWRMEIHQAKTYGERIADGRRIHLSISSIMRRLMGGSAAKSPRDVDTPTTCVLVHQLKGPLQNGESLRLSMFFSGAETERGQGSTDAIGLRVSRRWYSVYISESDTAAQHLRKQNNMQSSGEKRRLVSSCLQAQPGSGRRKQLSRYPALHELRYRQYTTSCECSQCLDWTDASWQATYTEPT